MPLELIRAIVPANRFQTARLGEAAQAIRSIEDFQRLVPFTTKEELIADQEQNPPYGTNLTYPLDRYNRFCQTSGTTGEPLRWLDTPESWEWMLGNWHTVFDKAGVRPADRILFAFSFGPFLGFWTAFEAAARMGCLCIPGGGLRSSARMHMLLDNQVTVLCCTPTYAIHLAEEAAGFKDSKVRLLIVAGEPGGAIPATRRHIEQLWPGARVFDHHGMTEVGPVSYECPRQPGVLHVIERSYFAEVVDPVTLQPTAPGGLGELVLTPFGRVGSPLLRYRTRDLVRHRSGRCACGTSDLALDGGILGRSDDMVIVRGVNVYPSAVENILRATGLVAEYRVTVREVKSLCALEVEVEPAPGCTSEVELAASVQGALYDAFALRIDTRAVPPRSLPRFEMKAQRWIRADKMAS